MTYHYSLIQFVASPWTRETVTLGFAAFDATGAVRVQWVADPERRVRSAFKKHPALGRLSAQIRNVESDLRSGEVTPDVIATLASRLPHELTLATPRGVGAGSLDDAVATLERVVISEQRVATSAGSRSRNVTQWSTTTQRLIQAYLASAQRSAPPRREPMRLFASEHQTDVQFAAGAQRALVYAPRDVDDGALAFASLVIERGAQQLGCEVAVLLRAKADEQTRKTWQQSLGVQTVLRLDEPAEVVEFLEVA